MTVCRTGKNMFYEKILPLRNVDIFAEAELEDKQLARKQKMLEFGGV